MEPHPRSPPPPRAQIHIRSNCTTAQLLPSLFDCHLRKPEGSGLEPRPPEQDEEGMGGGRVGVTVTLVRPGCNSWSCHLLAVLHGASHFAALSLSSHMYKIALTVLTPSSCWENEGSPKHPAPSHALFQMPAKRDPETQISKVIS